MSTFALANYTCYLSLTDYQYDSFICNANGTATIGPYSDSACTSAAGTAQTVNPNDCTYISGVFVKAICNAALLMDQIIYTTGYYEYHHCDAPGITYQYPLGTCITLKKTIPQTAFPSTVYLVYSATHSANSLNLEYSTYLTSNCSDAGSSKQVLLTAPGNCSSLNGVTASISSAVVPPLQSGYRNISLFSDRSCSGNPQIITHTTDGCIPISSFPFYVKLTCNPDNSTTLAFYNSDVTCSSTNYGTYAVQPSDCTPTGSSDFYFKTSCAYKPSAQPTGMPTQKPSKAPHTKKPSKKPTKTPHFKPTFKPTAAPM